MIPTWILKLPWNLIYTIAKRHSIDPILVAAIVQTESSGQRLAARFEPAYKYTHNINQYANSLGIDPETEKMLQSTSLGLMQIMGATARELGYGGMLTDLTNIKLNLDLGCKYIKTKIKSYGTDPADIYAAYNAGGVYKTAGGHYSNQRHVDNFMRNYLLITKYFDRDLKERTAK